ncbi:TOBE domain-containing protein [Oceanobacter mangrovi]|uniref:TOBE domain-containing protein n=1 Tax=Oceanobacter mangrovi TaxID=2862510 RepID=UPI001C8ECBA3|nr:TOBE domain-containing protein [Oceanobacter mangrovi]
MHLVGRILLDTDEGSLLADKRVRLLEAVAEHGTLQQAAKVVGLSYKAAWDAINSMNNLSDQPLVQREVGGRRGGGSALTEQGKKLVRFYRTVEKQYQQVLDQLSASLDDVDQFNHLMNRFAMRTSARNQLHGRVTALIQNQVNCEVRMKLDDQTTIVSIITNESVETLDLRIGMPIFALIKTNYVSLLENPADQPEIRNRLAGKLVEVRAGEQRSEVIIELSGLRNLVGSVANDQLDRMQLREGDAVTAVFDASSVILALVD